jgi:hypothetical protein
MAEDSEEKPKNFHEMELDNRILKVKHFKNNLRLGLLFHFCSLRP